MAAGGRSEGPGMATGTTAGTTPTPPAETTTGTGTATAPGTQTGTGTGARGGTQAGAGAGNATGPSTGFAQAFTAPPAPIGGRITISSPRDGLRLGTDDAPVVVVEGEVHDPGATSVWLFANGLRVRAPVTEGRFRHVLPVLEKEVRLQAETSGSGDRLIRSQPVTVHAGTVTERAAVIVADAPDVQVRATWRGTPTRVDVPVYPVNIKTVDPASGLPRGIFYVRSLREGVYTLSIGASSPLPESSVMYVRTEGAVTAHSLTSPSAMFSRIVTKLLMPFGVLWDQNGWFTGRSEGSDTITKFRFPEGVTWTERKSDVRR
jgi:hypothetical protein